MSSTKSSSSLPGPDTIYDVTLDNGLRLLVRENHSSPSVVINGYLAGGAVLEPEDQAGLSAFAASLLMRGTTSRTFEQINDAIESVGASLGVYSGRHAIAISGKGLAEDFGLLTAVLGDVLRNPTFPPEHVERVRGQRLTALQERDNDTRAVSSMLFHARAYPAGHPYSRPVDGYQDSIRSMARDDMVDFFRSSYGPDGGVLVVVGAVEAQEVHERVSEALGGWQGQPLRSVTFPEPTRPDSLVRDERIMAGKTQSDIVLGVPGLRRSDPEFHAARLGNTVLGRFGMMGRLGVNVREKLGLAYYSYSALVAGKEPGGWMVMAGVNPRNVERCLEAVDEELDRLGAELVPPEELKDSKAYLTGSLPLQLETNEGMAQAILDMVWYDLGLDYLLRYPDEVNAVTAEQVQSIAAEYLRPHAYVLAIAGPELADGQ